jgi:iron-sulfur cluster repair protein YtfE (RIC family)
MTSNRNRDPAVWAFAEHEHRDLARGINRIHDVACEVGQRATPELSVHLLEVLEWLDSTLAPHIAWEEAWLYPEIDARIGTPWATRAARFDHLQIREMATYLRADHDLLRGAQGGDKAETRCHLFSLEALVRAHLEREERFLIPLLVDDRLPRDADRSAAPIPTRR